MQTMLSSGTCLCEWVYQVHIEMSEQIFKNTRQGKSVVVSWVVVLAESS